MKILLYTDNHFCCHSSIVREKGARYSKRLENQIQSINWVEKVAEEYNCSKIICLGDFFDSPDLKSEELTALTEIQWNKNIEHLFLVGNHEIGSKDNLYNSTQALSKYGKVISKPSIDTGFGFEIIYLPYIVETDRKPLESYIKELQDDYYSGMFTTQEVKQRIILSHNDLAGIHYGQFISKSGFLIDDIEKSCSLFINGHLHNQTQISKKILNLGNLTGQNFSEDGFKFSHCIGILDTDTLKIDLINNPYALNFYKIDLTVSDASILDKCQNAVLTLRVPESQIQDIREKIAKNNNILFSRIVSVPESAKVISVETVNTIDHIEKFKSYIIENIGSSDIILDELSKL